MKKHAKRAQAEACAQTILPVTKSAQGTARSETSTIYRNVIDHIQHEVHSFLFVFSVS